MLGFLIMQFLFWLLVSLVAVLDAIDNAWDVVSYKPFVEEYKTWNTIRVIWKIPLLVLLIVFYIVAFLVTFWMWINSVPFRFICFLTTNERVEKFFKFVFMKSEPNDRIN